MEIITSRQNPRIKALAALSDKKGRERTGLFRFDGIKLFCDSLRTVSIKHVVIRHPVSDTVEDRVRAAVEQGLLCEEQLIYVSDSVFEKLTDESSPEGIITVAERIDRLHRTADQLSEAVESLDGKILLIAESVRDTGNLGTIMRSCAALGIDTLVLSHDCADIYNPKTVRAAMGALFRMPTLTVRQTELPEFIRELRKKGRRVYAAALRENAERIGEMTLRHGDCFIIGNEGHGLTEEIIEASDGAAIIPMVEGNESLNASAAATVCIWEIVRASKNRME